MVLHRNLHTSIAELQWTGWKHCPAFIIMTPFNYSIWLVPCSEQREALQTTIDALSMRFKTPSFSPHVTLCSGVWGRQKPELNELVDWLAADLPVTLSSGEIDWADHWSTFFFLKLVGSEDFFERAAAEVEGSHPPEVGPHLSLLYGMTMPATDRRALRQELAGPLPSELRFDTLELIRPAFGCWENVERWSCLHTASSH